MKRIIFELLVVLFQLIALYVLPVIADATDVMGLVVINVIISFVLTIICVLFSKYHFKYIYPVIILILSLPTIFIFFNVCSLYIIYYFISSVLAEVIGLIMIKYIRE